MRIKPIIFIVHGLFVLLMLNLFKLQVLEYDHYRNLSERNRVRPMRLQAPRGNILDRQGRPLVTNRLAFDCYMIPEEADETIHETISQLALLLDMPQETIESTYKKKRERRFRPVLIAKDIGKVSAFGIEELIDRLPGVIIQTRPVRHYEIGENAAHVLGYLGAIGPDEYKNLKHKGYSMTDRIGKSGLEKSYEDDLKGRDGAWQFEADSRGNLVRALSIQEPVEGKNIHTTLDRELQVKVSEHLKKQKGAILVMELDEGGLLAWASAPAYDPKIFSEQKRKSQGLGELLVDEKKPLLDRVLQGQYPPGSVFKIVTSSAAFRSGILEAVTEFFCPGSFSLGDYTFRCWYHQGHGAQGFVQALEHSCNVFFYNVASRLGINRLSKEARLFGLGSKTGVDMGGEEAGLVPGPEWKRKSQGKSWYQGETLILGIGQGALLTTPIQVLRVGAVIASGGYLIKPHLLKSIDSIEAKISRKKKIIKNGEALKLIRQGMEAVVQSPTGTGQRARSNALPIAGKTGTAESGGLKPDHAWFVGYAPVENPEYSIVIFLENGGKGGMSAATIGGKLLTWMKENHYFSNLS